MGTRYRTYKSPKPGKLFQIFGLCPIAFSLPIIFFFFYRIMVLQFYICAREPNIGEYRVPKRLF